MEQEEDPLWYKDAVIYELHVKAFSDGNGDGIGDFSGLISRLGYLQELGVNTLWLLPFYPSPMRDDGYDIADYHNVHPAFGDMEEFRKFVDEAHRRDMRVITELVINHTSDQHPWFQAARLAPPGSPKRDYYVWSDSEARYAGTRIIFTDTENSNWAWDEEARAFYWHRFFSHQPDLNFANPHVVAALMKVMRFWFDAGVDGMRLDAVPYLCEREGTSNENLPETHAVIRHLRAELDRHYRNRMFLAEANQWPEEVREYFGSGDECHMAYHFPLMPRMYMAIAQEDRHPIVEIMEQTPDIPDSCQWALFLRNHDELTLEMVTDRERDYLYQAYAADSRARLNLGIRRRLAPLLDNDRHRIELMNLLLMTMPGSPILYYGDEIGMGDNVQLGDRNGVRTPMQWSGGTNGGFSTVDPNRLYLQPIDDPVYGYGAVNVESQHRNPSSLLNWMRRLIAMRKGYQAFGRGSLVFLRPGNRKILAYLREHADETILCVANLSRAPQAVELDLSAFKGRVPVELMGRSRFPPVGELPYLLTLSGHGFYAFRLATDVEAPAWHEERPLAPDLPVLILGGAGWRTLFGHAGESEGFNQLLAERSKAQLARQVIPRFFRAQPWFMDSDAAIEKFDFAEMQEWTTESGSWLLTTVTVSLVGGGERRYTMPLALAWGDVEEGHVGTLLHATLAKVRWRAKVGILFDAFWDDAFCCAVAMGMARGATLDFGNGRLDFKSISAHIGLECPAESGPLARTVTERGRLRINLGDQLVLKAYRWLIEGVHPELEVSRFLTEHAQFPHIPQLAGTVEYVDGEGRESTLALLERYAENQGNAWEYTVDYLERFLDECRTVPGHASRHQPYTSLMRTLGRRTAEFHMALALPDEAGAFGTESFSTADVADWINDVRRRMESMYELLEFELPRLPETAQAAGNALVRARPRLYRRIMHACIVHPEFAKTRYHGDYHLGQVWLARNDFLIANYGGEPGRPWAERRRKHTPLRDVASMLMSLTEAGAVALEHVTGDPAEADALRSHLDDWETRAQRAFFRAYRQAMAGQPLLPADAATSKELMALTLMEKAISSTIKALEQRSPTVGAAMQRLLKLARRRERKA